MKIKYLPLVLVIVMAMAGTVGAAPLNFGFETGDLTWWASTANTSVVTSGLTSSGGTILPTQGTYMVQLDAGLGVDVNTIVSQAFTMSGGDTISGTAFFNGKDYLPYNDYAKAVMYSGASQWPLFSSDIAAVGDYGNSGWVTWSFTAPKDAIYYLEYTVANGVDNSLASQAFFDIPTAAVPIPGTLWLLGSGMLGLAALGWRRKTS